MGSRNTWHIVASWILLRRSGTLSVRVVWRPWLNVPHGESDKNPTRSNSPASSANGQARSGVDVAVCRFRL